MSDLKPVQGLRPFTKFCCTIGNIPASYLASMTYEEQLLWLCNYLENTVIPTVNNNAEAVEELQNLYVELKSYVDNYFTDLNIQNEINNKLDEMAESGTLQEIMNQYLMHTPFIFNNVNEMKQSTNLTNGSVALTKGYTTENDKGGAYYLITNTEPDNLYGVITLDNGLYAILNTLNPSPKMFGAIDSENVDQSQKIIESINYCLNNNIKELNLNGKYFVNTTMSFSNIQDLKICNGTLLVHEDDTLLNSNFNIFNFTNCKNIILDNIKAIETNPTQRTRKLQVGGFYFSNCKNCVVTNCYLENLCSGIILIQQSNNCNINNNIINVPFQSTQFAQSAILNYASSYNTISKNKIYGEYYDGTLSIFGGGSNDVIVCENELNNIPQGATPTYLSQGITIDQGPKGTLVINNIVKDMYYGIDNKAGTYYTKIEGNEIIGCKISIADRQGEAQNVNHSFGISIQNNKIIIKEDYPTNLGSYLHYNLFYFVGIVSQLRYSSLIKNNSIILYGSITQTVLGIDAYMPDDTPSQYQQIYDISNNNIELSSGILTTNSNAPTGSIGIILNNLKKGKITGNTFKVDIVNNTYSFIQLRNTNYYLEIMQNIAYMTSVDNHDFISLFDSATLSNSKIINNIRRNTKNIPNFEDITNLVEISDNNICNVSKTLNVSTEWTDAFKIYSKYANPVLIKLSALVNYSGVKIIDSLYEVYINGSNVTFTAIDEHNTNFDIQFVSGGNGYATCQVKSTTNFNASLKVAKFIPNSVSQQYLVN